MTTREFDFDDVPGYVALPFLPALPIRLVGCREVEQVAIEDCRLESGRYRQRPGRARIHTLDPLGSKRNKLLGIDSTRIAARSMDNSSVLSSSPMSMPNSASSPTSSDRKRTGSVCRVLSSITSVWTSSPSACRRVAIACAITPPSDQPSRWYGPCGWTERISST